MYIRQNPEKAFIALRMLSHKANNFFCHLDHALTELLDFAESSPEMIEWDEVDIIFNVVILILLDNEILIDKTGKLIAYLFRKVFILSRYP